jgi:hypothetical protein
VEVLVRIVLPLLAGAVGLAGCVSDFRPKFVLPSDCDRQLFFTDADGDGWGDPDGAFEALCQADPEASLTARNNLDCDDGDPVNTGRIGTLCPANLVPGGSAFKVLAVSGREAVAVLPSDRFQGGGETTPLKWANGAAQACGPTGWGGGLVTFANLTEFAAVTDAIAADMPDSGYYAAWVGLVPSADQRAWVWDGREGGLNLAEVGFCNPDDMPDPADTSHADRRLAVIRRAHTTRWCFGYPSDANPSTIGDGGVEYTRLDAHFICGRATPQAAAYPIDRPPEG